MYAVLIINVTRTILPATMNQTVMPTSPVSYAKLSHFGLLTCVFVDNLYINSGPNNITRTGTFTSVPYAFPTDAPSALKAIVDQYSGVGKI